MATNLSRVARRLRTLPRAAIDEAAGEIARAATRQLTRDTGGDRSLSGAPGRLKVTKRVTGDTVVEGKVTPNPAYLMAQWSWLEEGTGPPGPTAAKNTWTDPTGRALEHARRTIRQRLGELLG